MISHCPLLGPSHLRCFLITHSHPLVILDDRAPTGTVLCAARSEVSGNAHLVAHRILEKLPQEDRWAPCRIFQRGAVNPASSMQRLSMVLIA